jgi:hypothetical protein
MLSSHADATALLALIAGCEPAESWIEVRYQPTNERVTGWPSRWFRVRDVEHAASFAIETGRVVNVYAGTAPRVRKRGRAIDVERGWLLSADADTDRALVRLGAFPLTPTMIVASGGCTPSGRAKQHAYWKLTEALGRNELEAVKARLASALESDPAIASAAGILRVPGTMNHKAHGGTVRLVAFDPARMYSVETISAALGQTPLPGMRRRSEEGEINGLAWLEAQDDAVCRVAPPIYFRRLTGLTIPAGGGLVSCCLAGHAEKTPSLRVYAEPWEGWFCFGCRRGGSVFELAAHLYDVPLPLRGRAFMDVRNYLGRVLSEDLLRSELVANRSRS